MGTSHKKSCLGEDGRSLTPPVTLSRATLLRCRSGRRLDCVPLAHGALMEGGSPPRLFTREEALLLDDVISRIGSGYYPPRFRRAKLAMSFLVPTFSKAISKRLSLPMGVTDSTMPLPKTRWLTESPG